MTMKSIEIPYISSTANPRIKELGKLKNSSSLFLVEGFHLVEMAYLSKSLLEVYFTRELPSYLEGVKATKVSQQVLDKLTVSKTPEGIVGVCKLNPKETPLGDRVLVIDRVQDPGNIGTMLRSALSFAFKDVIFLPGTCSPFNPKAISSSQGAIFKLNLRFLSSEEALLPLLEEENVSLYTTALKDAVPLESYAFKKQERIALAFGNEGMGVSPFLLEKSKARLKIAMEGIDSLNVGVATGILLHSVYVL